MSQTYITGIEDKFEAILLAGGRGSRLNPLTESCPKPLLRIRRKPILEYVIYHAALALMSKEGYTSKNHSATLCFLIYHNYHLQNALAKEDVELIASSLEKEDIETLGTSKELREKACYNVHELFEKMLAEQIREQAVDFANKIKEFLR